MLSYRPSRDPPNDRRPPGGVSRDPSLAIAPRDRPGAPLEEEDRATNRPKENGDDSGPARGTRLRSLVRAAGTAVFKYIKYKMNIYD